MKKSLFILLSLLFFNHSIYSQDAETYPDLKKNELKLNLAVSIFGSYPEFSYERVLNSDFSIGGSLGFRVSDDQDYPMTFAVSPHVRWFFGGSYTSMQKVASGLFIELNSSVFNRDDVVEDTFIGQTATSKSKFGAGAGLAIGWKYVSKNNWVGEIYFGGGRDFVNQDYNYPRVGISIGKRF